MPNPLRLRRPALGEGEAQPGDAPIALATGPATEFSIVVSGASQGIAVPVPAAQAGVARRRRVLPRAGCAQLRDVATHDQWPRVALRGFGSRTDPLIP